MGKPPYYANPRNFRRLAAANELTHYKKGRPFQVVLRRRLRTDRPAARGFSAVNQKRGRRRLSENMGQPSLNWPPGAAVGEFPRGRRIGKVAILRQFARVGQASSQPTGRDRRSDGVWLLRQDSNYDPMVNSDCVNRRADEKVSALGTVADPGRREHFKHTK